MGRLPSELVNKIIDFTETPYIAYMLGIEPSKKTLFLGGGVLISLEYILTLGGDIKTLMFMKKYIPPYLAIYKAVCSMDPMMVIRVCLIWNSWTSNLAYSMSFEKKFKWGIENIKHGNVPITQGMYLRNNMFDNLALENGISHQIDIYDIVNSNLSEDMYDICIKDDPERLAVAKILRGIYREELSFTFIKDALSDIEHPKVNSFWYIISALVITNRFDDAISIYEHGATCDFASYESLSIICIAISYKRLDLLEYMDVEHIEVYKVLMGIEDPRILYDMDRSIIGYILLEIGMFGDAYDVELFENGEIKIEDAIYGYSDAFDEMDITRTFELNGSNKRDIIWLINRSQNSEHREITSDTRFISTILQNTIIYYPNMEKNVYIYDYRKMYIDKLYSPDISVAHWMYYGNGIIRNEE